MSIVFIDIVDIIVNFKKENGYSRDLYILNLFIDSSIFEIYDNINNILLSDIRFFLEYMDIIKS